MDEKKNRIGIGSVIAITGAIIAVGGFILRILVVLSSGGNWQANEVSFWDVTFNREKEPTEIAGAFPIDALTSMEIAANTPATPPGNNIETIEFEVFANRGWQNTDVDIQPGESVEISYLSGEWTSEIGTETYFGPHAGEAQKTAPCRPIPELDAALVGKFDTNTPFFVGYSYLSEANQRGSLYLRMNDCDEWATDNDGSIIVEIKIEESKGQDATSDTTDFYCSFGDSTPADSLSHQQFQTTLEPGEFVNGQSTEFMLSSFKEIGGTAYILKGPGEFNWSTLHGWWEICKNGTDIAALNKLDIQAESLESHGNTPTGYAKKIICESINSKVNCILD